MDARAVTNPERSVADAFRCRDQLGLAVRVESVIRPYLQAFL
ncbi:MAG: hypothetical protein ACYC8T_26870 [Myxococcaceae bacterium]